MHRGRKQLGFKLPKELGSGTINPIPVKEHPNTLNKITLSSASTIECYNYTGHVIRTYDHMGVCLTHAPITTSPEIPEFVGCFVIKKQLEINDKTQAYQTSWYQEDSKYFQTGNPTDEYSKTVTEIINRYRGLSRRIAGHYFKLSYTELNENEGSIYVRAVDLVVVDDTNKNSIIHPNSKQYMDIMIDRLYDANHTYTIEINDPNGSGEPYYVNLNGKVFAIQPTMNDYVGDGARIVYKPPNEPSQTIAVSSMDENELKNIGIFKNYSDADNYGKQYDLKLAELERETQLGKAELAKNTVDNKTQLDNLETTHKLTKILADMQALNQQAENDRIKSENEKAKHARELEKLERDLIIQQENHRREIENMRMKDYYDHRSHERKDSSEMVKFLPVLVGAGIAAFALLK